MPFNRRPALAALLLLLPACGSGSAALPAECPVLVGLNPSDTVDLRPGDTVRVTTSLRACEPSAGG